MDLEKLSRALNKFLTYNAADAKRKFPLFTKEMERLGEGGATPRETAKGLLYLKNDLFDEPPRDARLREEFDELGA